MDKFQNKYRIPSARHPHWNYGWNGTYFITICTHNRICYFGDIKQNEMHLSDMGTQAQKCAVEMPRHFPFVRMDEFVIMPNHVHFLLTIYKTGMHVDVETQNFASLQKQQTQINDNQLMHTNPYSENKFGPQSGNVASIIRGFKIGVTKYARNQEIDFAWQTRYYDRIVRNKQEYNRILNYIQNNINQWNNDSLNTI